MESLAVGLFIGWFLTYWYGKKLTRSKQYDEGYFRGWEDRHQAVPLRPRYWKYIHFLDPNDPLDQMELRGLLNDPHGSTEEKLENGLAPHLCRRNMEYALSDKELELLRSSDERLWRGILYAEEPEIKAEEGGKVVSRTPYPPGREDVEDVEALLSMGFGLEDIQKYYRVRDLEIVKNKLGKIVNVRVKKD